MIESSISFLIIDDDNAFRARLVRAISSRGYKVFDSACPDSALKIVQSKKPSHVILDLRMPRKSGLEILREIKRISSTSKVLILTGYGSIATALDAIREGAINYLSKPTDLDRILGAFSTNPIEHKTLSAVPSLSRVEWEHIQRVMQECGGNVSKAAKGLGLHRRSLQRKLKNPPRE